MDTASLSSWTFVAVMVAWLAFAVAFVARRRAPAAADRRRDRLGTAGLALQAVGYAAVWSLRRPAGSAFASLPLPVLAVVSGVAVATAFGSVLLVLWAVRTLGKQWALAARLVEGHELVTGGPYRAVRNPIYAGMLGMLLATGVAVSHPAGLALATGIFLAGTVVRVRAEERLLREAFGEAFSEWARRTAALVPGLW